MSRAAVFKTRGHCKLRCVQKGRMAFCRFESVIKKVKSMQRSGTEAIRTQIQPSKPNREITNITNSQNTKRTYGQPSEQLFPKRWQLSNRNGTKNNMNTHKVKRQQNPDTKNRQQRTTTKYRLDTVSNELLGWGA